MKFLIFESAFAGKTNDDRAIFVDPRTIAGVQPCNQTTLPPYCLLLGIGVGVLGSAAEVAARIERALEGGE